MNRTLRITMVSLAMLLVALATGCGAAARPTPTWHAAQDAPIVPVAPKPALPTEHVVAGGNHSYIILDMKGQPNEHISEIFQALRRFEDANPGLEVVSWKIDYRQHGTYSYIYGIWVDHRSKSRP